MDKLIRQAAFELYSLDTELHDKDVVKVASVFKRIVNWVKGFGDPEYKENIKKLQEQSPQIKHLIESLKNELLRLDAAINNSDPNQYGDALNAVKPLVAELSVSLSGLDAATSEAIANAPTEAIVDDKGNVYSEENFIQYVEGDYRKDPKTMERLKKQLPEELDVPIGRRLLQPLNSYEWFKKFTTDDIFISPTVAFKLSSIVKDALVTGEHGFNTYQAEQIVDSNLSGLLDNLKQAVLNGTLIHYTYPPVGGRGGKRTANQLQLVVNAGTVNIPNTNIYIEFPTVILTDKFASVDAIKKLDLWGARNVRFVSGSVPKEEKKEELKELPAVDVDLSELEQSIAHRINQMQKIASGFLPNFISKFNKEMGRAPKKEEITIARDRWARNILIEAFRREMGRDPVESEIQAAQAVAKLESNYGTGWKGEGSGSNNWGAIQCCLPKNGQCPPNSFMYTDTRPTEKGENIKYSVCFKSYKTPVEGAMDLIRTLYKSKHKDRGKKLIEAAQSGDLYRFSEAMYDTSYYQGHGKTREERIGNHVKAMNRYITDINKSTGLEPALFTEAKPELTERKDSDLSVLDEIRKLLKSLFANQDNSLIKESVYEGRLPKTKVLIRVGSSDIALPVRVRFAKILSTALRIEIEADSSIHNYKDNVEVECDVYGSKRTVLPAVRGLCDMVSEAFEESTGIKKISTNIFYNVKSSYGLVTSDFMESCFRKFAFDSIKAVFKPDLSYSAVMRELRKNHKDSVKSFQLVFKRAFESALDNNKENPEEIALAEALEFINVDLDI